MLFEPSYDDLAEVFKGDLRRFQLQFFTQCGEVRLKSYVPVEEPSSKGILKRGRLFALSSSTAEMSWTPYLHCFSHGACHQA